MTIFPLNADGWSRRRQYTHVRPWSAWSRPRQVGVTGMYLASPVVPDVRANMTGSSAVRTLLSPLTTRCIRSRRLS